MLQGFKKGDMTWDDVLLDFIEEHLPKEFVEQMVRRSEKGPYASLAEVRRKNGLR